MSYKHSPRFVLTPQYALPNWLSNAAPSVVRTGSGATSATVRYRVLASYDGAGRLHNVESNASTSLGVANTYDCTVSWSAINRARVYRLYKSIGAGPFNLLYVGPNRTFFDSAPEVAAGDEPIANVGTPSVNTTAGPLTIDLKPTVAEWVFVRSVVYEDQSEPETQAADRTLIAKEFGVRPRVALGFMIEPGSQEERDITAIYGAKLVFPDVVVSFTLFADGDLALALRPVRIVGNLSRVPAAGVNERIEFEWEIVAVDLIPMVPDMGGAANLKRRMGAW